MSDLRDVRLLIARHLELPSRQRAAILDVLNLIDAALDLEGFQSPQEVTDALHRLERAIVFDEDDTVDVTEEENEFDELDAQLMDVDEGEDDDDDEDL